MLTRPGAQRDIGSFLGLSVEVLRRSGKGLLNLSDALRHVTAAAEPFTRWFSKLALSWTGGIRDFFAQARHSGALAAFFDAAKASVKGLAGPWDRRISCSSVTRT